MRIILPLVSISLLLILFFSTAGVSYFSREDGQKLNAETIEGFAPVELSGANAFAKSLRLTDVDGELHIDENGDLLITPQLKNIFDYFLMALGEEELPVIIARTRAHLSSQLQEPALSQARQILQEYIEYKRAMFELSQTYNDQAAFLGTEFDVLQQQLDMQRRLRRELMQPETVQAFFEFDENYDQWSLKRLKIGADKTLSIEEKTRQLAALDAELPESINNLRMAASSPAQLRQAQKNQNFDSEDARYLFYQQQLGESAAIRLQKLDQERSKWQSRLDDYFVQKQQLMDVEGMDVSDLQQELNVLQHSLFNQRERLRLSALEAVYTNKS